MEQILTVTVDIILVVTQMFIIDFRKLESELNSDPKKALTIDIAGIVISGIC